MIQPPTRRLSAIQIRSYTPTLRVLYVYVLLLLYYCLENVMSGNGKAVTDMPRNLQSVGKCPEAVHIPVELQLGF